MFDYSEAMALANQSYRTNPKQYDVNIEWVKDGKHYSVPANYIDVGSTSIVFRGKDKYVYIGSRIDSQDRAKEILAMFNEQYGETAHIPFIEYIEETEFPFPTYDTSPSNIYTERENEDLVGTLKNKEPIGYEILPVKMYRSKFYKTPPTDACVRYGHILESFYQNTRFKVGRAVSDYVDKLIDEGVQPDEVDRLANIFELKKMSKILKDKRSFNPYMHKLSKTQKKIMLSIFESFGKLQKFVHENVDADTEIVSFEFQYFNLANDSKKRLILLDIFFTRKHF